MEQLFIVIILIVIICIVFYYIYKPLKNTNTNNPIKQNLPMIKNYYKSLSNYPTQIVIDVLSELNYKEINGHNKKQIMNVIKNHFEKKNGATIVLARTVKGKGSKTLESNLKFHHSVPSEIEYKNILKDLKGKKND